MFFFCLVVGSLCLEMYFHLIQSVQCLFIKSVRVWSRVHILHFNSLLSELLLHFEMS